jgi:hypothetical protein
VGSVSGAPVQPASPSPTRRSLRITRLRVDDHPLAFDVIAPRGMPVFCALIRSRAGRGARYARCGSDVVYRRLRPGAYRLRVRAAGRTARRAIRIPSAP